MVIHQGDALPLVEADASPLPSAACVKPPDADTLWQWQQSRANSTPTAAWASVWPAAALATYVTAQPRGGAPAAVADLGAGLGAVELTAASFGASSVTLIDSDPLALHCAMATAVLNGIRTGPVPTADGDDGDGVATVSAAAADWADVSRDPADPADAESLTLCADVVLCAEVLYDANEVSALARCVATLLRRGGSLLLSDPERERDGMQEAFMAELARLGARWPLNRFRRHPVYPTPSRSCWCALIAPVRPVVACERISRTHLVGPIERHDRLPPPISQRLRTSRPSPDKSRASPPSPASPPPPPRRRTPPHRALR